MQKRFLKPSLAEIIGETRDLALSSVGRVASSDVVQAPHTPVEGESDIPVMSPLEDIAEVTEAVEAAAAELASAQVTYDAAIAGHASAISAAETAISEAQETIGSLDGRIGDAVAEAAALASRVTSAEEAVASASSAATAAQSAAEAAQGKADTAAADLITLSGKTGRVIRSATAPTGADKIANNLWFNTSDGFLYQLAGSTWTKVVDPGVQAAAATADQAALLAGNAKTAADQAKGLADAAQAAADQAGTKAGQAETLALAVRGEAAAADAKAVTAQAAAVAAQSAADALYAQAENKAPNWSFEQGFAPWASNFSINAGHIQDRPDAWHGAKVATVAIISEAVHRVFLPQQVSAPTAPGRVWEVRSRIRPVGGTGQGQIGVYVHTAAGATSISTISVPGLEPDVWNTVSHRWTHAEGTAGTHVSPLVGMSAATGQGIRMEIDGIELRDVTDAVAAQASADAAATLAGQAKDAADAAMAKALAAQSAADTADAKATTADRRITIGTANPTATDAVGKPEGAIWEVWSSGKALRRFVLRSGAWVQTGLGPDFVGENAIGDAQVSSLSVGKLSGAVGEFTEAVVGKMTGHAAFLRNLLAQRVVIGSAENLIPNGAGEFGGLGGWTPSAGMTWDASDAPTGLPGSFVRVKGGGTAVSLMELVPVEPGGEYFYELWMKADVPDSRIYVHFLNQDGATPGGHYAIPGIESGGNLGTSDPGPRYAVTNKPVPTEWTRIAGRLVMDATTNAIRLSAIYYNHTNGSERNAEVKLAGLRLMKRATGELIVDGAISARHVQAEEVASAVGVFIDAMMKNLSVTGVANVKQLVADELFAKLAVVDKLQALTSVITQDMIATGAITSEKVAANAISAAMLDVGRNMRFTSNGLEIYAPVAGDQAYDDWVNRDLIVRLTPEGEVQISVAKAGQVTAGLQANGTVWGDRGEFQHLTVAGLSLDEYVARAPRGIVALVRSARTFTVGTTWAITLIGQAPAESGRMYRVAVALKATNTNATANVRLVMRAAPAGTTPSASAGITIYDSWTTLGPAGSNTHLDATAYVAGSLVNAETMTVWAMVMMTAGSMSIAADNSNGTGASTPSLMVEDIGNAPEIVEQQIGDGVVPQKNYSAVAWYSWWRGFASDGRHSVDSRPTVGGSIYGSDMHERVLIGVVDMTGPTSGATVTSATITVKRPPSDSGFSPVNWNIGFVGSASAPGSLPSITHLAAISIGYGESRQIAVPSAHLDKIRTGALRAIAISPGSGTTYGQVDPSATTIAYTYRK